ncbi:MAG TPA: entericidin EcnA/B family protein [Hyphomonadaceae bacterium]|jgi:predicted small secreted protein
MRKLILVAVLLAAPLMAAGCNTMSGLGKDLGAVGDALTGAAEEAK